MSKNKRPAPPSNDSAPAANVTPSDARQTARVAPPRKHPVLLTLSVVALVAWLSFLVYMALYM